MNNSTLATGWPENTVTLKKAWLDLLHEKSLSRFSDNSVLPDCGNHCSMMEKVISDTVCWIDNNLDRPLPVSEIADRSGYSRWYFQRCFSSITGYSLAGYIRGRRLIAAGEAVVCCTLNLTDIAYLHGFANQQSLSRAFRNFFGMTPTELRSCVRCYAGKEIFRRVRH